MTGTPVTIETKTHRDVLFYGASIIPLIYKAPHCRLSRRATDEVLNKMDTGLGAEITGY